MSSRSVIDPLEEAVQVAEKSLIVRHMTDPVSGRQVYVQPDGDRSLLTELLLGGYIVDQTAFDRRCEELLEPYPAQGRLCLGPTENVVRQVDGRTHKSILA